MEGYNFRWQAPQISSAPSLFDPSAAFREGFKASVDKKQGEESVKIAKERTAIAQEDLKLRKEASPSEIALREANADLARASADSSRESAIQLGKIALDSQENGFGQFLTKLNESIATMTGAPAKTGDVPGKSQGDLAPRKSQESKKKEDRLLLDLQTPFLPAEAFGLRTGMQKSKRQ